MQPGRTISQDDSILNWREIADFGFFLDPCLVCLRCGSMKVQHLSLGETRHERTDHCGSQIFLDRETPLDSRRHCLDRFPYINKRD